MNLKSCLESLLFVSIKAVPIKELAATCGVKTAEAEKALAELAAEYQAKSSGLALINHDDQYQLTTAAANASLVKEFLKSEATGELSQPSLEALTIIAYRGPISKLELEKIRGVNCSLIIRNLLLRGLIEEKFDKTKNENFYNITLDFIRFLGLQAVSELPDYERLNRSETLTEALSAVEEIK